MGQKYRQKNKVKNLIQKIFGYWYKPDFHHHSCASLLKFLLSPRYFHILSELSLIGPVPEDQHCNQQMNDQEMIIPWITQQRTHSQLQCPNRLQPLDCDDIKMTQHNNSKLKGKQINLKIKKLQAIHQHLHPKIFKKEQARVIHGTREFKSQSNAEGQLSSWVKLPGLVKEIHLKKV